MTDLRQITKLAYPFPQRVIKTNPSGGGSYVAHPVVEQRILDVLGRPPDTAVATILRGWVPGIDPNPNGSSNRAKQGRPELASAVVGVVLRMSAVVDGEPWSAEEAGDCEDPHNWSTDGQRLKDAMSDAYKRCAMRLGVGLHLWAADDFYLAEKLQKQDEEHPPMSVSQSDHIAKVMSGMTVQEGSDFEAWLRAEGLPTAMSRLDHDQADQVIAHLDELESF